MRFVRTCRLAGTGAGAAAVLLCGLASADLVLHYDFSERGGTVLHDRSGRGHDARISGAHWVVSDNGAALDFDGVDDFCESGNPIGLRINGALTLAIWVRLVPSPQDQDRYVISKYGWSIYIDARGQPHLETRGSADDRWVDLGASRPLRAGEWNLIVAVHDPSARQMRMYLNGQAAGERSRPDDVLGRVGSHTLYVGKFAPWAPELNGLVGGVMLFDEPLSAARIAQLYEQPPDDALRIEPHRLGTRLRYHYGDRKLLVDLQLTSRAPPAPTTVRAEIELADANGTVLERARTVLGPDRHASVPLAMPGEPGDYALRTWVRAGADLLAETTATAKISRYDPAQWAWKDSTAGISGDVPPPWTPLRVRQLKQSVSVEAWGRQYEFRPDSFVSAIRVGEHDLLAGPVRLLVRSEAGAVPSPNPSLTVVEAAADRVRLAQVAGTEQTLRVDVTVDYDGMIWFDWRISDPPSPLTGLVLEIPLAEKYARLFWHNRYPDITWAKQKPGLLPADGFAGPFLPALWLGNEEHGLQWFAESAASWRLARPQRAIEIVRDPGRVTVRIHMIDAAADVGDSVSGSFGLQATPVKPWGKTLWDYRFRVETNFGEPLTWYGPHFDDAVVPHGIRTVTIFENWNDTHSYVSTIPEKEAKLREIVRILHDRGMQVLLYFGGFISGRAPEAGALWDECVKFPESGWSDYNYPPIPRQKLMKVCYNSVWQDLLAHGIARAMQEFDLDGVYLDGVGDVVPCTNSQHGCGAAAADGTVRPTYPIRATRRLLQRIYRIVKTYKPDGQVKLHQSGQMIAPVLGFATSYWDGEQFTGYQDKFLLDFLPLDTFRTEFIGRQWGVPAEMLQYRLPGTEHEKKGLFLLHDVNDEAGYDTNKKLFEVFDAFERRAATWLPYWSNADHVTVTPEAAKVSLYRHPRNGVLVMVCNTARAAANVSVQLTQKTLPRSMSATAVDAMTGLEVPLSEGRFTRKLAALDWALVWVKP